MDSSGSASEEANSVEHPKVPVSSNGSQDVSVPYTTDNSTGLFKCHMCPYRTPYKGSLKSHFAVHSNDRPYACDLCEYEAKRLYDLKKHKIFKHGKKNLVTRRMKRNPGGLTKLTKDRRKSSPYKSISHIASTSVDQPLAIPAPSGTGPVFPEPVAVTDSEEGSPSEKVIMVKPEPCPDQFWHEQKEESENDAVLDMRMSRNLNLEMQEADGGGAADSNSLANPSYIFDGPPTQVPLQHPTLYSSGQAAYSEYPPHFTPKRDTSRSPEGQHDAISTQRERTSSSSSSASMILSLLQRSRSSLSQSQDQLYPLSCQEAHTPKYARPDGTPPSFTPGRNSVTTLDLSKPGIVRQICSGEEESADESSGSSAHNVPSSTSSRGTATATRRAWHCGSCDILFFDSAIYFIHMGLHNRMDPWECNLCGDKCHDVYSFTSHFVNEHKCK